MKRERRSDEMLFVVETIGGTRSERERLRRGVDSALGIDAAGKPWRIEPLFPNLGRKKNVMKRFFRVRGRLDAPVQRWDKIAFEMAYRLRRETGFRVEPDLPSSIFAPPTGGRPQPSGEPPATDDLTVAADVFSTPAHRNSSQPFTWALDSIRARDAWALTPKPGGAARGEGIVVAHPDTGYSNLPPIDLSTFDRNKDRDVLSNDDDALDPLEQTIFIQVLQPGHGTSAGSVIAGQMIHDIQGVAPRARIVPIRTMKSVWHVFNSDVARAVNYARQIGAHVISMSLGGVFFQGGLEEAINAAIDEGIIVLAAAGNFVDFVVDPANYARCIAVAASNSDDGEWPDSCRGEKVAFSAPGESVWAAEFFFKPPPARLDIARQSGTTFAVSMSAGVAALWLAHHGRDNLIAHFGRNRLQAAFLHMVSTVGKRRPSNWDTNNFGVGIIDAHALLSAPLPPSTAVADVMPVSLDVEEPRAASVRMIARLFPDLSIAEVEQRLEATFGVTGEALAVKLDQYGSEMAWILSEQGAARDAFLAGAGDIPSGDPGSAESDAVLTPTPLIAQFGSASLAGELRRGT